MAGRSTVGLEKWNAEHELEREVCLTPSIKVPDVALVKGLREGPAVTPPRHERQQAAKGGVV
ncbi:hypothetical protein PoMZ_11661 [Pyricularia oryzae]|uniref:Uncharacterized protein n=1 Tax=Pyricularia oryzae TaxID=318829 RepID=A0A4P7NKZ0_PYROR|nr:hypothetical protein PoMZ_11661 [Pyricularia oryzae]